MNYIALQHSVHPLHISVHLAICNYAHTLHHSTTKQMLILPSTIIQILKIGDHKW